MGFQAIVSISLFKRFWEKRRTRICMFFERVIRTLSVFSFGDFGRFFENSVFAIFQKPLMRVWYNVDVSL